MVRVIPCCGHVCALAIPPDARFVIERAFELDGRDPKEELFILSEEEKFIIVCREIQLAEFKSAIRGDLLIERECDNGLRAIETIDVEVCRIVLALCPG